MKRGPARRCPGSRRGCSWTARSRPLRTACSSSAATSRCARTRRSASPRSRSRSRRRSPLSCLPLDERLDGGCSATRPASAASRSSRFPRGGRGAVLVLERRLLGGAARRCARGCGVPFAQAMRERVLEPLGLAATGYEEPPAPARGHVQEGETGHRPVSADAYPAERGRPAGSGRPSATCSRFAAHHLGGPGPLGEEARAAMRLPRSQALGAGYGLGWWVREDGGRRHTRPRGLGRRLPVAAPARPGGAARARGA